MSDWRPSPGARRIALGWSLALVAGAAEAMPSRAAPARSSAQPQEADPFTIQATLGAGFDSNVARLPDTAAYGGASSRESPLMTGNASLTWRPTTAASDRASLTAYGAYDRFTDLQQYDAGVAGLRGAWQQRDGGWLYGGAVDLRRHWLDQRPAAAVVSAGPRLSAFNERQVLSLSIDGQRQEYDRRSDADGWVVDDAVRWWLLPEANVADRRVEVMLRHVDYRPNDRWLGYTAIIPGLGATWRFGAPRSPGTCEAGASGSYETRTYHSADPARGATERRRILAAQAGAQVWLDRHLSIGAQLRWSDQDANTDGGDYSRTQAIGNVTYLW